MPATPKLLFVSTVYPTPWEPHKGPANRSTVESLRLLGCDVRVVAPVPWTKRTRSPVRVTPVEHYPTYWYTPRVLQSRYHAMMGWSIGRNLANVTREFRPDAVLAAWADPEGTVALRHAHALGVPAGVIAMGSDVMLLPQSAPRRRVIAATIENADHVFAVGSVLQRTAIELGARPERVSNFLCGVDLTRFGPGDCGGARARLGLRTGGPLLLWIGSMGTVKATERLLYAAGRLTAEFPELSIALVGDGPRRLFLEQVIAGTPTLAGRVHFAGSVAHDNLPDWYRAASLFVLPSRSEGVPNVLLEAMTCGLPFVASDVGSIADLLPYGGSAVVPEGDIPALTNAVGDALRSNPTGIAPRSYDRLEGGRHLLQHLGLNRGAS